ncbi:MAG: copper-binding protein [Verrucomicrobiae bacterium]|nr:copper-binding protein [Verrucomicrobiae bacterium]
MKLKFLPIIPSGLLIAAALAGLSHSTFAQSDDDIIEATRSILKADRQAVVSEAMQLTEAEAKSFWPIYQKYRAEMDTVGDGVKHLVLEYAGLYPDVPDARAKTMLKELAAVEKKHAATRATYLGKVARVLPAAKTLRFAQVESRLDLATRLELAACIPLVPITGEIAGRLSAGAAFVEGTVGGVFVETLEISAKIAAIDKASRKVTLISEDGIKQVVKVGPEVINFDQIRVGDQLKVELTEELVVQIGGKDDVSGGAALVALAPKGAKPGGLVAEAVQVIGTITAIDTDGRTAMLKFEDGTTKTFPVRDDVDLAGRKVGDKVVFRVTEVIATSVVKP